MCFLVTFCTMQKVTTRSLCREHRGFPNLDSARRNGGFARTKLNPFKESFEVLQTSNQHTKQQLRTNKIKTFPKGASRFCKPRISAPKQRLRTNPIKSFCRPCLPPHGRLAHVRSQFSLFRRSPTHKNLPLAIFCTSEQKVCPCRDGTLRVLFLPLRGLFFGGHAAFLCCLRRLFSYFL